MYFYHQVICSPNSAVMVVFAVVPVDLSVLQMFVIAGAMADS